MVHKNVWLFYTITTSKNLNPIFKNILANFLFIKKGKEAFMYFLEGNQSVGKSTFLNLLAKRLPHIEIELEPIENWQKKRHGQSLLANFFNNPKRWALTIDTFTLMCRVREHKIQQQNLNPNRVLERSIYSGYYGYAMCDYNCGYMTDMEWSLHNEWLACLTEKCKPPIGFIYLKVDPKLAHARSKKRNREEEKNVPLEFFEQLGKQHDDFLIHKKNVAPNIQSVPVLVLDCNQEFESDEKVLQSHLQKVQEFMIDTQINLKHKNKIKETII